MSSAWRQPGPGQHAQRLVRLAAAACCMAGAVGLGGCGSVSEKMSGPLGSLPGIGLPGNAPERPATVSAYPAVHEMPPPRTTAVLTGPEQSQIEEELVAAREQQKEMAAPPPPEPEPQQAAKPAKPAKSAKPAKPAKRTTAARKPASRAASTPMPNLVPTSSSRTIY